MPARKRQAMLVTLMLVLLLLATSWSVNWMVEQRAAAKSAAEDLAFCRDLAAPIERLRGNATIAKSSEMAVQELGARIESATKQAQMGSASLEGVFPQAARRVGDSPYLRKPTTLTLRGVTLGQLVTFLHHVVDQSELNVDELRIQAPRENAAVLWDAEATVTYLIFAPPTNTRRGR